MHILLIVSHGSRREKSNQEIEQLVKNISNQIDYNFDSVMLAFLEFAKPSIVQAIDQCSRVGAKKVTVLPYFLSA